MPVVGERIAERYRLDRRIAVGGMGAVWLARDELLRRPVAVKTLHLQAGLAAEDRDVITQRAMREARITARLHHPHAVQVFDIVDEPDGPCLIMEYVPSRSLQDLVRVDGPLPVHDTARIGGQIAAALAAAHRAGIVHRDVKPGNVLIGDDGTAKLTDFGISHAFDDVTLTSTGMVTGTPAFLAPEVARGAPSNAASDVYSLGVTLYFALEGESPFGADANPMAVLHRVASEPPRPPRRAGPLRPLLQAMMAPRPEGRPAMSDIAARLPAMQLVPADVAAQDTEPMRSAPRTVTPTRTFAAAVPPARTERPGPPPASPPSPPSPPEPDRDEPRRRWPIVLAALAVVAVAAVIGGILLAQSGGSGSGSANGPASTSRSVSTRPSTKTSSSPASSQATSPEASSPAPSSSTPSQTSSAAGSTSAPAASARVTDADLAGAVTQYFQLVPGDLDGGWARLTTQFQNGRAGGRQTYDDYWNSISRVDVADVQGNAPHTATARLTYHYKDGRVVTQRTTFTFAKQDGELKIADES